MRKLFVVILPLLALVAGPRAQPAAADIVLTNGRIFTGVATQPWVDALAITGERISAAGTNAAVTEGARGATRVIDLRGRLVIPGFNDAHAHPGAMPVAERLQGPPVVEHDPTFPEVIERLKAAVGRAPKDVWIFGEIGGAVLDDAEATRFAIDAVAPSHPVMLEAWTGHGTLFNTVALRRLGVRDDEPDPPGGSFRRMPGTATISGIAQEYAEYRLRRRISMQPSAAAQRDAFRRDAIEAAGFGVTTVQAMMTSLPTAEAVRHLSGQDLPIRFRLIDFPLAPMSTWQKPAALGESGRITVSGTKWILDGTPIERGMWTQDPYVDRPTHGRANFSADDLRAFFAGARAAREQPIVHAVGDAAIEAVLDALERTGGEAWRPLRPRIEHGDMLRPDQFQRALRFGVVIVQNPSHFMIPAVMRSRLGDAVAARVTAIRSTIAAGIPVAFGSDGPMNPFLNLMFATINANNPGEALTLEQALVAYTKGSAIAERQESNKGTLEVGKLADLAVLSRDIFKIPPAQLPETTSVLTIVGGRIVHEQK
jgi:predicted amidohydrolase YtcJ